MAKENYELMGINFTCVNSAKLQTIVAAEVVQDQNDIQQVAENLSSCEWYSCIIHFLQKLEVPPDLTPNQARSLNIRGILGSKMGLIRKIVK